jgi:sigma-E factor negative regulatory protein RseA
MDTNRMTRERISGFVDGELDASEHEQALAELRTCEARADWEIYHQIGDALRSDDMAVQLTPQFSASMAARLAAEPVFVAPARQPSVRGGAGMLAPRRLRTIVGAAAVATFAFVATPQLIDAFKGDPDSAPMISTGPAAAPSAEVVATIVDDGVILRDARIDDYLLAHQRFSPSLYSSAQYVRSTTNSSK